MTRQIFQKGEQILPFQFTRKIGANYTTVAVGMVGNRRRYCRTGFDSDSLTAAQIVMNESSLSLGFAIEIISIIPYMGIVFPFAGSLMLDAYQFYFLILKETLTFLSLSNLVLQYVILGFDKSSGDTNARITSSMISGTNCVDVERFAFPNDRFRYTKL